MQHNSRASLRKIRLAAVAAAATLVLAGCGGSSGAASDFEAVDDPFPELSAAAEAEGGKINYYFLAGASANQALFDAFTKQYPFASIETTGGDPLGLIEKVVTEDSNSAPVADILQGGPMEDQVLNLDGKTIGLSYRPVGEAEVPELLRMNTGNFVVPDYFTFHIAYNTDKVAESPTSVEDFTDPAWNGRFGVDMEQLDWFAGELAYYGEEEGMALMQEIAANGAVPVNGAEGHEQLAAGQLDAIINMGSANVANYIDEGAPIAPAKQDHLIAQPDMYIPIANGPNPATTKLFLEWLFTEPAQQILAEGPKKNPVLAGIEPPLGETCTDGCELFWETTENFGDFDQRVAAFQDVFLK